MKDYEKLEIQAKLMRMVEGTDLEWWQCLKHDGDVWPCFAPPPALNTDISRYELALAIVEGKPVFYGDKLYCLISNHIFTVKGLCNGGRGLEYQEVFQGRACVGKQDVSWNPPKPKIMTIELIEEDVKYWVKLDKKANYIHATDEAVRFYNAVHNAKPKEA